MNTDFTLATEHVQLMTEGQIAPQRRELSDTSLFQQDIKTYSPLHNLKNYCFTTKSSDKNQNGTNSNITSDHPRSSVQEENFLNSVQEEQLKAFEHRLFNPGNEFTAIDNIIYQQQNNHVTNEILQIKIDHASDIFEFFEKEPSYHAIEIIDYERFLTVSEFARIDQQLRGLSKKFRALRITNVELTPQHLKILEFGVLSKRNDLEIQLNNNNIDDQNFFQFLLESRCYKTIQFINNIGILKFIEQIYYKHQSQSGKPRNMIRISQYSVVLERSDDDLVFTLHTGSNQFSFLSSSDELKQKYPIVNYDLKASSKQLVQDILTRKFSRINLPQILFLAIKIEAWNVNLASEAIEQIKTINTLDLGGSKDLADQHVARLFLKDRIFKIKELIIRNIPFTNPAFKLFVQHFVYSDFTTLKALDISDCEINDEKIFLLCENIRLRKEKISLAQLYLQRNPLIGEEGWRRLFSLMIFGQCTSITDLDIRGCLITYKHLKEGIIAGMRSSHRFIRKFCIRFPLRRFFISTSELTTESWKALLTQFLFYAKMGLTHYNFFFTGFFMSNNVLSNESLFLQMNNHDHKLNSENNHTPLRFSSPRFDLNYGNNKSNPSFNPPQVNSFQSTPNSLANQGKETSINAIQFSNKNTSHQIRASQSSASSETNTQNGKKKNSISQPDQNINYFNETQFLNTIMHNQINDSIISQEANNSNMNFSINSSVNQNTNSANNNSYVINSPSLTQKSPSQTQINQTKSLFSKESVLKSQIHQRKSGSGASNSKVQFLQQEIVSIPSFNLKNSSSKDGLSSPVAFKNSTIITQFQKSNYQIPQSPGARSLESFNSIKSTPKEKEKSNEKKLGTNLSNKQIENQKTDEGIINEKQECQQLKCSHPKIKRSFQQLGSKQMTDQTLEGEQSVILTSQSKNIFKSREWTISAINSAEIDMSKIEAIGGVGSSNISGQQQSLSEAVKSRKKSALKQQNLIYNNYSPLKKSTSLKNLNTFQNVESDSQQMRNQWQKLNSYSHQRYQKEKQVGYKFKRSITHNSSSSAYKNIEESSKLSSQNYSKSPVLQSSSPTIQEKAGTLKSFFKKSSFGYKHVKSTQEIMDNINQVVFTESEKPLTIINGSPELLVNSKHMKGISSQNQLNQQGQVNISQHKQLIKFNSAEKIFMQKKNSDLIDEKEKISDRVQESCERNGVQVSFNLHEEYLENAENTLSVKQQQSNKRVHSQDKGKIHFSPDLQSSPNPKSSHSISEKTIIEPVNFLKTTSINVKNNQQFQFDLSGTKNQNVIKEEEQDASPLQLDCSVKVPPIVFPPSLSDADENKQNEKDQKSEKSKKINFEKPKLGSIEQNKGFEQKLSQKQTLAMEKVKKNQFLKKNYRKKNVAGIIHKEEVVGTIENAIFHLFEGFLKMKRNILQQIIFHNNEQFPYLSPQKTDSSIPEFQGNISPAGWQRLFFLINKCSVFIVPIKKTNSVIPVLPLFNEKFEYQQPISEHLIKTSPCTELYKNLKFFYINADSQLYKIYRGNLTPLQWLYFNPNSNIQIIKSNCYSTFINLEKNIYQESNNNYKFKVEIIDFNWEGEEKGWKVFAKNVMLNNRFQLKQLYLKNVQIDTILTLIEEYKSKYNTTIIPSQLWDLDILCFSFSQCSSTPSFIKFLFIFFSVSLLKIVYNGMEDQFYVFGPNYKEEILDFRISSTNSRMLDDPYCLNQQSTTPFRLFAPYIAHFFVNVQGNFFPHFFTKSVTVQLTDIFQFNQIIQIFNLHKRLFSTNLNAKIQGYLQSRTPTPPALKLKQFICDSYKQHSRTQYSKLIEPCYIISQSREDFTDQIISFNCSLFEGGSLIIDPPKLKQIIIAVNLINIYLFDQKTQQDSNFNLTKTQSKENRSLSLRDKINQEVHVYLTFEEKLCRYKDVVGFKDSRQEICLYLNYSQYLQFKEYMKKMLSFGFIPQYHHPYNYYNCLDMDCKSVALIFETTCSNSCGSRCGRTADVLYYYDQMYHLSQKIPDYLTFIKLNKKVSPYFFSPFLWKKIVEMYNEEHLLNFLYCTAYIEYYNYNFFDYIKILHCYIILALQILIGASIMLYNEIYHFGDQIEISMTILSLSFTALLFFYELYLVFQLFQKSKPLIPIKKLRAKRRLIDKQASMKAHSSGTNLNKVKRLSSSSGFHNFQHTGSASALGANFSKHSLDKIEYYPIQEHWLLYQSPKEIQFQNKFSIAFASLRSFISTLTFFIQILLISISRYVVISTCFIYLVVYLLVKRKNQTKIYRDNIWIKAFIMNIVEFDILELFASRISYSYVFTLPNIPILLGKYAGKNISGKLVLSLIKLMIRDIPIYLIWDLKENNHGVEDILLNIIFLANLCIHVMTLLIEKTKRISKFDILNLIQSTNTSKYQKAPETAQEIVQHSRKLLEKVKDKYLAEYDKQIETFLSFFR